MAYVLFPKALGELGHPGGAAAADMAAQRKTGILVMVVGYFYHLAGRNNAEWFFAGSILDRLVVSVLATLLVLTGGATLPQIAGQTVVDVASAAYTYKLYQEDLAGRQVKPRK